MHTAVRTVGVNCVLHDRRGGIQSVLEIPSPDFAFFGMVFEASNPLHNTLAQPDVMRCFRSRHTAFRFAWHTWYSEREPCAF